jgi:hypothetical protein
MLKQLPDKLVTDLGREVLPQGRQQRMLLRDRNGGEHVQHEGHLSVVQPPVADQQRRQHRRSRPGCEPLGTGTLEGLQFVRQPRGCRTVVARLENLLFTLQHVRPHSGRRLRITGALHLVGDHRCEPLAFDALQVFEGRGGQPAPAPGHRDQPGHRVADVFVEPIAGDGRSLGFQLAAQHRLRSLRRTHQHEGLEQAFALFLVGLRHNAIGDAVQGRKLRASQKCANVVRRAHLELQPPPFRRHDNARNAKGSTGPQDGGGQQCRVFQHRLTSWM